MYGSSVPSCLGSVDLWLQQPESQDRTFPRDLASAHFCCSECCHQWASIVKLPQALHHLPVGMSLGEAEQTKSSAKKFPNAPFMAHPTPSLLPVVSWHVQRSSHGSFSCHGSLKAVLFLLQVQDRAGDPALPVVSHPATAHPGLQ